MTKQFDQLDGHALVTGASGFIGRHLTTALHNLGLKVTGIGHGRYQEEDQRSHGLSAWLNGEISPANLELVSDTHGAPNYIFHLAGGSAVGPSYTAPLEDFSRSVETVSRLAEWVRLRTPSTRLIMASSAAVYGAQHKSPIATTAFPSPYSPYGYNKRMAELVLESYSRNFGLRTGIIRYFSVYGPNLRKQLLWDICTKLSASPSVLKLGGSGQEMRDWIHVRDAVLAAIDLCRSLKDSFTIWNGGTGVATPVADIAQHLINCWAMTSSVSLQFSGDARAGDPYYLVADTSADSRSLVQNVDWRDGLKDYVDWFRFRPQ